MLIVASGVTREEMIAWLLKCGCGGKLNAYTWMHSTTAPSPFNIESFWPRWCRSSVRRYSARTELAWIGPVNFESIILQGW